MLPVDTFRVEVVLPDCALTGVYESSHLEPASQHLTFDTLSEHSHSEDAMTQQLIIKNTFLDFGEIIEELGRGKCHNIGVHSNGVDIPPLTNKIGV